MNEKQNRSERFVRKTVIDSLPTFWIYSVASCFMSLIIQITGLIPAILMQRVIDIYIPYGQIDRIFLCLFLFCIIPIVTTILSGAYRYKLAIVCRKMGVKLAIRGFQNLINQPVTYFDHNNSSELATYCRTESMRYISFWIIEIPQLIAMGINALIILYFIFFIHWGLALALLLYFPVAFIPSRFFSNKISEFSKIIVKNNGKMLEILTDTFRGIKTVKSMSLEDMMVEKFNQVNSKNVAVWSKVALYDNMSGIWVSDFAGTLFHGLSFGISAFFAVVGLVSLGNIVAGLNYTAKFISVARNLVETNYNFKKQLGEYDKLFEILTLPQNIKYGDRPFRFSRQIKFNNVHFTYDTSRGSVLNGVNLKINKGEWLGIIGASGSGKTTVFDLLLRFYEPQSGKITVDGIPLDNIDHSDLCKKVSLVSQEIFLFPGTVRDNLLLAKPDATQTELNDVLAYVQLKHFFDSLPAGLDTEIGENGQLLSGGERQRLGLAQGLLRNCEIILLDEITANIDPESEGKIRKILAELRQTKKLTIIAISHRMDFLSEASRIIKIENGKIEPI